MLPSVTPLEVTILYEKEADNSVQQFLKDSNIEIGAPFAHSPKQSTSHIKHSACISPDL